MKYYKVSEEDLKHLIEYRAKFEALEAGGVEDHWDWYEKANNNYLEDYFSDRDPDWFETNDLNFELIVEKEIENFKEI